MIKPLCGFVTVCRKISTFHAEVKQPTTKAVLISSSRPTLGGIYEWALILRLCIWCFKAADTHVQTKGVNKNYESDAKGKHVVQKILRQVNL